MLLCSLLTVAVNPWSTPPISTLLMSPLPSNSTRIVDRAPPESSYAPNQDVLLPPPPPPLSPPMRLHPINATAATSVASPTDRRFISTSIVMPAHLKAFVPGALHEGIFPPGAKTSRANPAARVNLGLAPAAIGLHRSSIVTILRSSHGYRQDRKSTRLNSSHSQISYAVFCLKKKKKKDKQMAGPCRLAGDAREAG